MTISKKGYLFMILLLGVTFTGIGLIFAHPYTPYPGIGGSGIHATINGSIHIPGEIIFDSIGDSSITLYHNATSQRTLVLPDHQGTIIIVELPFSCPALRAITGFDENGNPICSII